MSKHFSIFQTENQWNAAKDSLDYPHVSLIDTTGDMHYAKYTGKEVADAPFGSILMDEVATNKLFYIEDSDDYNLTDYPIESFKPIAVCIYDKSSNANNQTVFMAVQWADYTDLGTPKASRKTMSFGFYQIDLSSKVSGITDTGTNHISSISINSEMKKLVTTDYSGSSISDNYGDGESSALCSAWRFKTAGTNEGDWYLPSRYDLSKYQQNYSSINEVLTKIKTVAGSSYLNDVYYRMWTTTEYNSQNNYVLHDSGGTFNTQLKNSKYFCCRPVFICHIEEV